MGSCVQHENSGVQYPQERGCVVTLRDMFELAVTVRARL